jgi:PIN domain nuclease of toxin-antitoxin system
MIKEGLRVTVPFKDKTLCVVAVEVQLVPSRCHQDPFDRLLLAQSAVHDLRIVTPDPAFRRYRAKLLW